MNLETPKGVEKLQTALHVKAKGSPSFRFYLLYDKVYRPDVLQFAYALCYANGGAPGVDGQTFDDIGEYGTGRWLDELAEGSGGALFLRLHARSHCVGMTTRRCTNRPRRLRTKTYEPQPVRRVWIPKANGEQRPLAPLRTRTRPTIRDRVVQTAAVLVLEPIFEADLQPEQYAYRSGKSALDAVRHVHSLLNSGHTDVVDADLNFFTPLAFQSFRHAPPEDCGMVSRSWNEKTSTRSRTSNS